MKCSDFVGWIGRKLDGSLSEDQLLTLDRHLATCGRCRAELNLQRRIVESLEEEGSSGLSAGFTQRVSEHVRRKSPGERFAWRWPALVPAFASAAAAVLVFVFRTGIAAAVAPRMERFGATVATPLASVGQSVLDIFAAAPDLTGRSITITESVSPIPLTVLAAASIACLAVAVAFYKASTLFNE
ncbi:MAG: zf-HC2 domain-containing protein [Candidatus Eisenbacteria bacterium]